MGRKQGVVVLLGILQAIGCQVNFVSNLGVMDVASWELWGTLLLLASTWHG